MISISWAILIPLLQVPFHISAWMFHCFPLSISFSTSLRFRFFSPPHHSSQLLLIKLTSTLLWCSGLISSTKFSFKLDCKFLLSTPTGYRTGHGYFSQSPYTVTPKNLVPVWAHNHSLSYPVPDYLKVWVCHTCERQLSVMCAGGGVNIAGL